MSQRPPEHLPATLVHIGMPKCGSTWLQRQLFKPVNGYLLRYGPMESRLAFAEGGRDDWQPPEKLLGLKRAGGRVPTISGEMLAGDPLTGGHDRDLILSRLHSTLPRARILIVIREQADMFRSLYKLLVNWGYDATPEELLREERPGDGRYFRLDYLRYDRLIADYQAAFGRGRVLVLPFEMFRDEPQRFLGAINRFSECRPTGDSVQARTDQVLNPGSGLANLALKRLYNRHIARTPFSPGGLYRPESIHAAGNIHLLAPRFIESRLERAFERATRERLRNYFRQSNRLTAQLTGLDLESLGYSCADESESTAPGSAQQTSETP